MWERDSWNTKCQCKRYGAKEVNTLYATTEKRLRIQYSACRPDVACLWYIFIIKTLLHIDKYIENASEGALCSQTSNQPTDWLNDRTSVQLNSLFKVKWHEFEFEFVIVSVLVGTILVFLSFFRFAFIASHSHALIAQEFASDSCHVRAWNKLHSTHSNFNTVSQIKFNSRRPQLTKCGKKIYIHIYIYHKRWAKADLKKK